jgi:hypothetical protein
MIHTGKPRFLHANTRHIPEGAEHTAFAFSGQHLGPTRGAVMADLSQAARNVAFSGAPTERTCQIRFCDNIHDNTVSASVREFHDCPPTHGTESTLKGTKTAKYDRQTPDR